jgi:ornithine cyclodeaminase/alanine dehydrogenase-like protein (mu-crystallin family)
MKLGREVLYLSNDDIESCGLPESEVERVVEAMFSAKASGAASMKPKLALHTSAGPLFLASPGLLSSPSYAGLKWVAVAENHDQGLPHIAGIILLSDAGTGIRSGAPDEYADLSPILVIGSLDELG